eukprot:TRINITY_DN57668_c0_g1_i1.p1 TRINITY_DN57668_c0_g1~~TRINITY_DN57668_c0_g1_i1.p1  ORF type:complete len:268 (-),score=6.46 TRINITY_DN57668_c0_g1_i1:46-786(-)
MTHFRQDPRYADTTWITRDPVIQPMVRADDGSSCLTMRTAGLRDQIEYGVCTQEPKLGGAIDPAKFADQRTYWDDKIVPNRPARVRPDSMRHVWTDKTVRQERRALSVGRHGDEWDAGVKTVKERAPMRNAPVPACALPPGSRAAHRHAEAVRWRAEKTLPPHESYDDSTVMSRCEAPVATAHRGPRRPIEHSGPWESGLKTLGEPKRVYKAAHPDTYNFVPVRPFSRPSGQRYANTPAHKPTRIY